MKKILLLAVALLSTMPAIYAAPVDATTYDEIDGLTLTNKWLYSAYGSGDEWNALECSASNYARTAALDPNSNEVYVASSQDEIGTVYVFDLFSGELLNTLALTLDGEAYTGLCCANQIGVDDAGNVYLCSYTSGILDHPIVVYTLDIETGALTVAAESLTVNADEADAAGRVDYIHIIGDVTGQTSGALCMAASSDVWAVYRWRLDQGTTEWYGDFDGYVSLIDFEDTYPSGEILWGTAPTVTIVNDDEISGDYFYVDGFSTIATLYNTSGAIVSSFAEVTNSNVTIPNTGTNGIAEFSIADKDFVVYSNNQYVSPDYCSTSICELGDGQSFDMTPYWVTAQLGDTSDGGARIHCLATKKFEDANGLEGVYYLEYKCRNGMGVYEIAQEGFIDPDGGVEAIAADAAAAATISVAGKVISVSENASVISVYNLAGQKVAEVKNAQEIAAPAAGAYVVKAVVDGAAVVAKVII